jgi:hypothetical protein
MTWAIIPCDGPRHHHAMFVSDSVSPRVNLAQVSALMTNSTITNASRMPISSMTGP